LLSNQLPTNYYYYSTIFDLSGLFDLMQTDQKKKTCEKANTFPNLAAGIFPSTTMQKYNYEIAELKAEIKICDCWLFDRKMFQQMN